MRLSRESSEKAATVPIHPFSRIKFGHINQFLKFIFLGNANHLKQVFMKAKLLDLNVAIHLQCTLTAFIFLFKTKN